MKETKVYLRYLYIPNVDERDTMRDYLNKKGFYTLHAPDGLEVYAISHTLDFVEWMIQKFKYLINGR